MKLRTNRKYPPFPKFVKFVTEEENVACEPVTGALITKQDKVKDTSFQRDSVQDTYNPKRQASSLSTGAHTKLYPFCDKFHDLEQCDAFLKMSIK